MHELGHAHGYMGDEYRTDDDRDVSRYADLNVNTSTQSDVTLLKWHHHIDDLTNVLGKEDMNFSKFTLLANKLSNLIEV